MSNKVVPLPARPTKITTDERFGGCPRCGRNNGYVDYGREHWFFCEVHRFKWYAGENLFSSWHEPQSQKEISATMRVMSFATIEPIYPTEPDTVSDETASVGERQDDLEIPF